MREREQGSVSTTSENPDLRSREYGSMSTDNDDGPHTPDRDIEISEGTPTAGGYIQQPFPACSYWLRHGADGGCDCPERPYSSNIEQNPSQKWTGEDAPDRPEEEYDSDPPLEMARTPTGRRQIPLGLTEMERDGPGPEYYDLGERQYQNGG